jgi:hypothetical protein
LKGLLKQAEQERDEAVRRNERPKRNREWCGEIRSRRYTHTCTQVR